MKLSSKIATSFSFFLVLLVGVVLYDLAQLRRLAEVQEGLSRIDISATSSSLELTRLLGDMEEMTQKLLISRDSRYGDRLQEIEAEFDNELGRLRELPLDGRQLAETNALEQLWREMPLAGIRKWALAETLDREQEAELNDIFLELSGQVGETIRRVNVATQESVEAQVEAATQAGQKASAVSKAVMIAVLSLGLPVLFFILASIRQPLKRLREGTRSVAAGAFDVELEAEGDDEFSGVAASFNKMVRRLGELERMKQGFLSHVSHELKTPLAAMQETNRALLEEIPGELNPKQKRLLELNIDSQRRLSAMIAKLLDAARLEEGAVSYDFHECDLSELLREVADGFTAAAQERGVRLEVEAGEAAGPVTAECDRDRIVQVVVNLLENALKFSPPGSAVRLAAVTGNGAPHSILSVIDSGPGIPDDHKERIFDKFHQLGGPDTSSGGVGLGLTICREIAAAHGGKLWVEDAQGEGSAFFLSLPAKRVQSRSESVSGSTRS